MNNLNQHQREMIEAEQKRQDILAEIVSERYAQVRKWGEQHHSPGKWMLILIEEVGEVAQAVLQGKPYSDIRQELIQCAAVIVAWLEDSSAFGNLED